MGCTSSVSIPHSPLHTSPTTTKGKSAHLVASLMECWSHPHSDAFDWAATSVAIMRLAADVWTSVHPSLSPAQRAQLADALAAIDADKPGHGISRELDSLDRTPEVCLKQSPADPTRPLRELGLCLHKLTAAPQEWAEVVVSLVEFVSVLLESVALSTVQCQYLRAAALEFNPVHSPPRRATPAFDDYETNPFHHLCIQSPTTSTREWLLQLPSGDHRRRFPSDAVCRALFKLDSHVDRLLEDTALMADHFGSSPTAEQHVWAVAVYTAELYDDPEETKRSAYQIYREFNAACRVHSHEATLSEEQRRDWQLFLPFAQSLQAAIAALPRVTVSLCRATGPGDSFHPAVCGCLSATTSPQHVAAKDPPSSLPSSHLIILSDTARSVERLSLFPMEEEHLHPLGTELEECHVFPPSLLRTFGPHFSLVTMKPKGSPLTLALLTDALKCLWALRGTAGQTYVPHRVKVSPSARQDVALEAMVAAFLTEAKPDHPLLLTGPSGIGKTHCALWLTQRVHHAGRLWLFVSLPAVKNLFSPNALASHLFTDYGLEGNAAAQEQLRREPLVLVLDGLDELEPPSSPPMQSWWELNQFDRWNVRLVVTCQDGPARAFGRCLGPQPRMLFLQHFDEVAQVECLAKWLRALRTEEARANPRETQAAPVNPSPSLSPAGLQQDARWLLSKLSKLPLRAELAIPLHLMMAADLVTEGHQDYLANISLLYGRWLDRALARPALGQRPSTARTRQLELMEMERLAWEMHRRGVSQDMVSLGSKTWFHKLPVKLNGFNPDCPFNFECKSLRDYLVASHLFRRLQAGDLRQELDVDLTHNVAVLKFFGELLRNCLHGAPLYQRLLAHVLASPHHPEMAQCAANSMSLLAAAHFSFNGLDLRGIRAPGAVLRGALLQSTNLEGAHLRSADFRGAIMDEAILQNADLVECNFGELLHILEGHSSAIHSVAMSADGRLIASASYDGCVRLWDGSTGTAIHILQGHRSAVYSVAMAANGLVVASGSRDGAICLWNGASGELLRTLEGHDGAVNGVALSADGRLVVSASDDGTVRIWKCDTGDLLCSLHGKGGIVYGVALSADMSVLASASDDGVVRLWRVATGEPIRTLKGHTGIVYGVALSADGGIVASASRDETVRIWNCNTGELEHTLEGHHGIVYGVAISADGGTVASASRDRTVRLWDRLTGVQGLASSEVHNSTATAVVLSGDGAVVASGSADGSIRVSSRSTGFSSGPALQPVAVPSLRILAKDLRLSRGAPSYRLLQRFGAVEV